MIVDHAHQQRVATHRLMQSRVQKCMEICAVAGTLWHARDIETFIDLFGYHRALKQAAFFARLAQKEHRQEATADLCALAGAALAGGASAKEAAAIARETAELLTKARQEAA